MVGPIDGYRLMQGKTAKSSSELQITKGRLLPLFTTPNENPITWGGREPHAEQYGVQPPQVH